MSVNNGEGEKDTSNTSQKIVGEELMVEAELIAEESKGNKRHRHGEKDGDKEDRDDLPGSKKSKKSPKKNQSRRMSMNNGEGEKDTPNDEKDGDKEDREDLPGSEKSMKSPKKNQPRRRGRPSGKNKENKENVFFVRRSTFGKLSGKM